MRATLPAVFLILAVTIPSAAAAQERGTGLSREQWGHWAIKVGAATGGYQTLRMLDAQPEFSAALATAAPTIVGKLIYMDDGLGDDPARRWPSRTFVLKDIAGELCVQSAPLWVRLAVGGRKNDRLLRSVLALGGYGLAVFTCARTLEVR